MKHHETFEHYNNKLANAIRLSKDTGEVLKGLYNARRFLKGAAGHSFGWCVSKEDLNRVQIVQAFDYEGQKIALHDVTWKSWIVDMPKDYSWYPQDAQLSNSIRNDANLKNKLTPRELYIHFGKKCFVYNAAEDILLGKEPEIRLFRDNSEIDTKK